MNAFPLISLLVALLAMPAAPAAAFDPEHRALGDVLGGFLDGGLVDYAGLRVEREGLDGYLASLSVVSKTEIEGWPEAEQIAFFVNAYNAWTLRLIVDHYPVGSIKDIGGFFSGPWKEEIVRLFGKTLTLDHIEHEILRKAYAEPRIHFALVCAAVGCPPLRGEPYIGARLDEQLDDQGRVFLSNRQKNRLDTENRTLYLSPIFKWFREDFTKPVGSLVAFVRPFLPRKDQAALEDSFRIRFTDYDWSLNEQTMRSNQ